MIDPNNLSRHPYPLVVDGVTYELHPLPIEDWIGPMQAWVDRQFPDPFDVVNRQIEAGRPGVDDDGQPCRVPYTMAQQQFLYRVAMDQSAKGRRLIGTTDADEKVQGVEGIKQLLLVSIRKSKPEFNDADADALFARLTVGDVARVFQATHANLVLDMEGGSGPKGTRPNGSAMRPPQPAKGKGSTSGRSSTKR